MWASAGLSGLSWKNPKNLQQQIIWSFSSVNSEVYNTGICLYSFCIHDIWSSACHHLYPSLSELLCHSFNHFNRGLSWVDLFKDLQQNRCISLLYIDQADLQDRSKKWHDKHLLDSALQMNTNEIRQIKNLVATLSDQNFICHRLMRHYQLLGAAE